MKAKLTCALITSTFVASLLLAGCNRHRVTSSVPLAAKAESTSKKIETPVTSINIPSKNPKVSKEPAKERVKKASKKSTEELDPAEAEKQISYAEILLQPAALSGALDATTKAYEADPNHPKTLLFLMTLKPLEKLKGFRHRIAKLPKASLSLPIQPEFADVLISKAWVFIEDLLKKYPKLGEYLDFETKPFKHYQELQAFIAQELIPSIEESLILADELLSREKIEPVSVKLKVSAWKTQNTPDENSNFEVDKVDIQVIRAVLSTALIFSKVFVSYNIENLDAVLQQVTSEESKEGVQEKYAVYGRKFVKAARKHPNFLKLIDGDSLNEIPVFTTQLLRDLMDFAILESTICSEQSSRTNHLFSKVCVSKSFLPNLILTHQLIENPKTVPLGRDRFGDKVKVVMSRLDLFFENPPRDLKTFLPKRFSMAGEPAELEDPSLGGLLPNRDFLESLEKIAKLPGK